MDIILPYHQLLLKELNKLITLPNIIDQLTNSRLFSKLVRDDGISWGHG